jgi:hypothetical protein
VTKKEGIKQSFLIFVNLLMLLQLENIHQDDLNKLLAFARENHLNLSLIDESETDLLLPGKPLSHEQLTQLIETSRKSGIISMNDAHEIIINTYNAD